jgi:hypothetical protein
MGTVRHWELFKGKLNYLSEEEKQVIEPVLLKNAHVFDELANDVKETDVIEHQILLDDAADKEPPILRPLLFERK